MDDYTSKLAYAMLYSEDSSVAVFIMGIISH